MSLLAIPTGLLGGSGYLSELAFAIGLYGPPTVFIIWAVLKIDPRSLGEITGHDRWKAEQQKRQWGKRGEDELDSPSPATTKDAR